MEGIHNGGGRGDVRNHERTFRRWSGRFDAEGAEGFAGSADWPSLGSGRAVDDVMAMLALYQIRYTGWTAKHFHARWHTEHGGTRSYSWTKQKLQGRGMSRGRRGAHRKKRPRRKP